MTNGSVRRRHAGGPARTWPGSPRSRSRRSRPSCSSEGVPGTAATVIPQIGSTATSAAWRRPGAACRRAAPSRDAPDDPGEDRQRDLRRACARRCRARRARRCARAAPSATPSPRSSPSTAGAALAAGDQADVGQPGLEAAAQRVQLVAAVRGDDEREVARPRIERVAVRGDQRRARARRRVRSSAPAIGVSPTTSTRGAGSTGSRKTSIAPPDRHGFCDRHRAVLARDLRPVGARRLVAERAGSAAARPRRSRAPAASRRARCARRRRRRRSPRSSRRRARARRCPASTLVGRCARTTVAVTNGDARRGELLRPPATCAADIIAAARGAPASPPTRAPGCRACRCGRRRASRAARRSPR